LRPRKTESLSPTVKSSIFEMGHDTGLVTTISSHTNLAWKSRKEDLEPSEEEEKTDQDIK
jgi:hypothetical protein